MTLCSDQLTRLPDFLVASIFAYPRLQVRLLPPSVNILVVAVNQKIFIFLSF